MKGTKTPQPFILALGGQKGGAGKTTSAIALATELHQRGRRVLLVDTDPQGSTRTWAAVASEQGVSIPTVIAMGAGLHQPEQLPRLAAGYDLTVVDCPPRLDALQREVLMITDAVVIPCGPAAPEAWAMADATTLVRRAIELRSALRAFVLITKKQPRTSVGAQARTMLEAVQLPVLTTELCYRVTYQEALAAGQGPTTYAPKSAAAAEVRTLANELVMRLAWKA